MASPRPDRLGGVGRRWLDKVRGPDLRGKTTGHAGKRRPELSAANPDAGLADGSQARRKLSNYISTCARQFMNRKRIGVGGTVYS